MGGRVHRTPHGVDQGESRVGAPRECVSVSTEYSYCTVRVCMGAREVRRRGRGRECERSKVRVREQGSGLFAEDGCSVPLRLQAML